MKKEAFLGLGTSIAIIIAMVLVFDPATLFDRARRAVPGLIYIVLMLYMLNLLTKGLRWHLLVNASGRPAPFKVTFPNLVIGLALNNVTPGKIGGEPVRAMLLRKQADVPVGQATASILAEKIMDLSTITAMAMIGAFFIIPLLPVEQAEAIVLALVIVGTIIALALAAVTHRSFLEKSVDRSMKLSERVSKNGKLARPASAARGFTARFREGMDRIAGNRRSAAACIALTILIWCNEALRLYLIVLALPGVTDPGLGAVFIASGIANVLGVALPLGAGNIMGIGTVFLALGIDPDVASAASFLHVATSIWISVPLGAVALAASGTSLSYKGRESGANPHDSDNFAARPKAKCGGGEDGRRSPSPRIRGAFSSVQSGWDKHSTRQRKGKGKR